METHIKAIKAAVVNSQKPPVFVTGTWSIPKDVLHLFYRSNEDAPRVVQFPANLVECEALGKACQPATFGVNNKNVLDESYRKAGKMDRSQFSISFDGAMGVSLEKAAKQLVTPLDEAPSKDIEVELYKLNVYGPGSFFKPHRDTPRSEHMFGSIIITLPTEFKGGELIFRHDGKEFIYDYSTEKKKTTAQAGEEIVSWMAFFSDIEHEVLPVTEGYRVTLTYNLYRSAGLPTKPSSPPVYREELKSVIQQAFNDSSFLPQGFMLGFGLSHKYPISGTTSFTQIALKGYDAVLMNAFEVNGVKGHLKAVYKDDFIRSDYREWDKEIYKKISRNWLTEKFINVPEYDSEDCGYLWDAFHETKDVLNVLSFNNISDVKSAFNKDFNPNLPLLLWVTPPSKATRLKTNYVAYGNEATLATIYADLNLVFTIPSKEKRGFN